MSPVNQMWSPSELTSGYVSLPCFVSPTPCSPFLTKASDIDLLRAVKLIPTHDVELTSDEQHAFNLYKLKIAEGILDKCISNSQVWIRDTSIIGVLQWNRR
jgi:hypothetical protein